MASICKGLLQRSWQPHIQALRYRSKINITKPRPQHFERSLIEHIVRPYFFKEKKIRYIPDPQQCNIKKKRVLQPHSSEVVVAREALNWFKNSKLIVFFHQNAMEPEEIFQAKLSLKKINIRWKQYSKRVMKLALVDSIYEPALVLFKSSTIIGLSNETEIHELINTVKKLPKLPLLAAILDNRMLSYSELQLYGQFENLDQVRMKLLGTLNLVSQNLVQQLTHHPNNVVQLLKQHQELNKEKTIK